MSVVTGHTCNDTKGFAGSLPKEERQKNCRACCALAKKRAELLAASEPQTQELKARLLELVAPIDAFMREYGVASFSLPTADETLDFSAFRRPLPPNIKCVLEVRGCIYVEDDDKGGMSSGEPRKDGE